MQKLLVSPYFRLSVTKCFTDTSLKNVSVYGSQIEALQNVVRTFGENGVNLSFARTQLTNGESVGSRRYRMDLSYRANPGINIKSIISQLQNSSFSVFQEPPIRMPWFPKTLDEVNLIGKSLMKLEEPQEDIDYKARRDSIAAKSLDYRMGNIIPDVDYSQEENELWIRINKQLKPIQKQHMSPMYLSYRNQFEKTFPLERKIPQLQELSTYLKENTGFQIKPVPGIISSREFLNCLAFKVICCTQFIRNRKTPEESYEPDICHDCIGHMPMFADPNIAEISQQIGLLSLGASPQLIKKLAAIYFFTIQFGVFKQTQKFKAYGAAIAGSIAELQNMTHPKTKLQKFDPFTVCQRSYPIQGLQPTYFYTESLAETVSLIQNFSKALDKPISLIYNDNTKSIEYDRNIECFDEEAMQRTKEC